MNADERRGDEGGRHRRDRPGVTGDGHEGVENPRAGEDPLGDEDTLEDGGEPVGVALRRRLLRYEERRAERRAERRDRWEAWGIVLAIAGTMLLIASLGRDWWRRLRAGELHVFEDTFGALVEHWAGALIGVALLAWGRYLLSDVWRWDRERETAREDRERWERWREFDAQAKRAESSEAPTGRGPGEPGD